MNAQNVGGVYYTVDLDTRRLLTESPRVGRELRAVEFRMGAVALAVQGLAAALALLKMAAVADEMRLLGARVQVAAGSVERGAAAMAELQRISARTQTEVAANVQVFTRLNSSITQMGGTQQDTLRITELLAKAIKVSGASGVEAASAMTQFGQALGSGKLAGDELRSLLENAPYLMRQLADGIGVPVGALKDLGEQGKLTADVVVAALSRAATTIDADFKKLPQTFEAAMGALVDQLRRASEAADTLTGTSALLTGAAKGASDAVGLFADQLVRMVSESDKLGRNDAIGEWSRRTTLVLSYVADAADITWQTLSVLGRNVGFVFATVGDRLGNLAAQAKAIVNGDAAGAEALEREFRAVAAAREVLSTFCDQDDLAPLIGEPEPEPLAYTFRLDAPPRWKFGAITEREQVILARHLMQHAVAGKARPGSEAACGGEYATEFHVGQHVSAAQVHLGLSEADALACSMTKLQELMEAKFPDKSRSGPKNVPSRSQYHEAMKRLEERRAAGGATDARRREMVGG